MSPLVGFKCFKATSGVTFDFCWEACEKLCKPLPVLLSLAHQYRPTEPNIYHVTEILNPPRIVYLSRNNDFYLAPDSIIDMHIGTAWHEKVEETKKYVKELGLEDEYLMEHNFKKQFVVQTSKVKNVETDPYEFEEVTLSGTSDLYVRPTKTLFDYKIMKYFYTFKYLSEMKWEDSTIPWQMNIYRVYQYPEAEHLKIFCYLKDWKRNFPEKYGVDLTEILDVPRIPDRVVKNRVVDLLTEHVTNQLDPTKIRDCTKEESWGGIRCESYCPVADLCPQRKE